MLVTAAVLVLAQAAGAPADPRHTRGECLAVQVISPQQPKVKPRPEFSATRILDVEFLTFLRRSLPGPHTLQLKVFTPRRHLYQVLTIPFTMAAGRSATSPRSRQVDGYPQAVVEQQAVAVGYEGVRRPRVSAVLPVAGTSIMTNSLYGEWSVQPYLDGDSVPCGPPKAFHIGQ